jgi:hypothetical protein
VISKPNLPSTSCKCEHGNYTTASPRVAENTVLESPMVVSTSPRALGQVGSTCVMGSRIIGVLVGGCQSSCVVVRGCTAAGVAERTKRRGVMTVLQQNTSRQVKTGSRLVVIGRVAVAEGVQWASYNKRKYCYHITSC